MSEDIDINKDIEKEINTLIKTDVSNTKKILVLSGGGMRGIALHGVLKALHDLKILENIEIFSCASVGALVVSLYIIGYNINEIEEFYQIFDYSNLTTISDYTLDNINDLIKYYGIDNGKNVTKVIAKLLEGKNLNENITLLELYKITHKKFIVTGTCLETHSVEYISHETYPNMKFIDALKITSAVPLYYQPIKYNDKTYVDGGCIDNYPIILFQDRLEEVIGVYLHGKYKDIKINNIKDYIFTVMESLNLSFVSNIVRGWEKVTINLYIDYVLLDFNMSLEEKKKLFDIGYKETLKFFK